MFKSVRWLLTALAALPAVIPLYIIWKFGVNIPFQDEWHPGIANLFIKAHEGHFNPLDLFAQHNEHRIVIPRLVFFVVGMLSRGNSFALMYCIWGFACLTSLGILRLIARTHHPATPLPRGDRSLEPRILLLWFICNLLLFTPVGWENWMWGMGVQNILPILWLTAGLIVADMALSPTLAAVLGILVCVAATCTSGNGVAMWVILGIVIFWSDSWEQLLQRKWLLLALVAVFLLTCGLYAIHYVKPNPPPDVNPNVTLWDRILYVFCFLGGPFTFGSPWAPLIMASAMGAIMFCLLLGAAGYFVWLWWWKNERQLSRRLLIWLAFSSLALFSALFGAILRANLFSGQAVSSRYTEFAMCLPLALVNLVPMICQDIWYRRRSRTPARIITIPAAGPAGVLPPPLPGSGSNLPRAAGGFWLQIPAMLLTPFLLIYFQGFPESRRSMNNATFFREQWKGATMLARIAPNNPILLDAAHETLPEMLQEVYAYNEWGWLRPPLIESTNVSTFRADPATTPPNAFAGAMEQLAQDQNGVIRATGWAALPYLTQAAHVVFLAYENPSHDWIVLTVGQNGVARSDVAQGLRNDVYTNTGWIAGFTTSQLPQGMSSIKISAWTLNAETGKAHMLPGERVLVQGNTAK